MRKILFFALLAGLIASCAPQIQADKGEVVYEVPNLSLFAGQRLQGQAGSPVITSLSQSVATYYALEATPLPGYGRWVQRLSEGASAIYVSEKRDSTGKVVQVIEMRWTFGVRADGFGSVRLQTLASEPIDVGAVEGPAFGRLDRDFRRVASNR